MINLLILIKQIFYDDTEEQQPTQHQQPTLPKELATDEAKEYLDKAIKGGFCNENYNWLKSKSLLAYFCDRVAEKINLSNGVYDNRNKVYWKPFEELFNVKNLTQRKKDYQRSGSLPNGHENIDAMFD